MSTEYKSIIDTQFVGQEALAEYQTGIEGIESYTVTLGETTQRTTTLMSRSWRRSLFGLQMGLFYFSMLESAMYRNEAAALSLENAQDAYNSAVRENGVNSEQAIRAERTLERTKRYIETANRRVIVSYIGMGLQVVSFVASLQVESVATLWNTLTKTANTAATTVNTAAGSANILQRVVGIGSTISATVVEWAHAAALWASANAFNILTFGAAAAAGAITMYGISIAQAQRQTEMMEQSVEGLHDAVGEGPRSTGLVKSFEDLNAVIEAASPNISISGTFNMGASVEALDRALEELRRQATYALRRVSG